MKGKGVGLWYNSRFNPKECTHVHGSALQCIFRLITSRGMVTCNHNSLFGYYCYMHIFLGFFSLCIPLQVQCEPHWYLFIEVSLFRESLTATEEVVDNTFQTSDCLTTLTHAISLCQVSVVLLQLVINWRCQRLINPTSLLATCAS